MDGGEYICSVMKNSSSNIESYQEYLHAYVRVKMRPGKEDLFTFLNIMNNLFIYQNVYDVKKGPVSSFRARATTIIAVLIWEVWRNRTGGSPIIDFTAEMREIPNKSYENYTGDEIAWIKIEPNHITPNARYLEVYHLSPNTTYQFRIYANNEVGAGEPCMISATTLKPTQEEGNIKT
jgi:hypothetical protein